MTNKQLHDLQQFFLGTITQATANMATKRDLAETEQRIKQQINQHVDNRINEVLNAIGETFGQFINYTDGRFDESQGGSSPRLQPTTS